MEKQLEKVLEFEGQEIKVITDKGVEMFNLANSAKVIGLTKKSGNGTEIVNWKSGNSNVFSKLKSIYSCGTDVPPQYLEELNQILEDIDNVDDRKTIFVWVDIYGRLNNGNFTRYRESKID